MTQKKKQLPASVYPPKVDFTSIWQSAVLISDTEMSTEALQFYQKFIQ